MDTENLKELLEESQTEDSQDNTDSSQKDESNDAGEDDTDRAEMDSAKQEVDESSILSKDNESDEKELPSVNDDDEDMEDKDLGEASELQQNVMDNKMAEDSADVEMLKADDSEDSPIKQIGKLTSSDEVMQEPLVKSEDEFSELNMVKNLQSAADETHPDAVKSELQPMEIDDKIEPRKEVNPFGLHSEMTIKEEPQFMDVDDKEKSDALKQTKSSELAASSDIKVESDFVKTEDKIEVNPNKGSLHDFQGVSNRYELNIINPQVASSLGSGESKLKETLTKNPAPTLRKTETSKNEVDDALSALATAAIDHGKDTNKKTDSKDAKEIWHTVGFVKDTSINVQNYFYYDEGSETYTDDNLPNASLLNRINLEPGTAYKFRVAAINSVGRSDWSEVSAFKTCVPGFPSAPSAIKIAKSVDGAHISWEPPKGDITEYSVYLAVRNNAKDNVTPTSMAFVRIYCGVSNSCTVSHASLASAFVDTTTKSAIIFRIAARNEKGYGPATQVRWLQEAIGRGATKRPIDDGQSALKKTRNE